VYVDRQVGHCIVAFGPISMIGRTFYVPMHSTGDKYTYKFRPLNLVIAFRINQHNKKMFLEQITLSLK